MRNPRFFEPQPLNEGSEIHLSDSVVQHVCRALRMRPGDQITLFNGDGGEFQAELIQVDKRKATARLLTHEYPAVESPLQVHIGQTLSRGERMDYAVQKATELGAKQITPLFSERCEVKLPPDRQAKRISHWQQVAISASEQCGRTVPTAIAQPNSLEAWVKEQQTELKFVLHHHSAQPLSELAPPTSISLLIGPEGGLTPAEVELAQDFGFKPLTLGPRVMRTETAPVAALALLNHLWGDFR